jgi:hypothetical protein
VSARASTSSRRMVRWLSHRPWSRAPRADGIAGGSDRVSTELLALLRVCPPLLGQDALLRDFFPHPLGFSIEARHVPCGVGILHIAQAVPNEPTDVELVVQDTRPALAVSVDWSRTPATAERNGDALSNAGSVLTVAHPIATSPSEPFRLVKSDYETRSSRESEGIARAPD